MLYTSIGGEKMLTEQFNMRLPSRLLHDLDVISKLLRVNKTEWVKTKLADEVYREKNRLLMELGNLYVQGMISEKEIKTLVGADVAKRMRLIRTKAKKSAVMGLKHGRKRKR